MSLVLLTLYTLFALPIVVVLCWKLAAFGASLIGGDALTSFFGVLCVLAAIFIALMVFSVWFRAVETTQGKRESYTHDKKDCECSGDCKCEDEGDEPRCGHDCGCRKRQVK